jgi:hypothetical protein
MDNESRKREEIRIIDHFRLHCKDFPKGVLLSSESPDFILRQRKGSAIGIELTSIKTSEGHDRLSVLMAMVRETLRIKNQKYLLYRKGRFSSIWLIIYCDYLEWPQSLHPSDLLRMADTESRFDRTFIFNLFKNEIFEL